ncbi:MAG TPA: hypothetical protein VF544_02810 [Pyrinomonadaceae bacterium]|jgi:hypothetical protein
MKTETSKISNLAVFLAAIALLMLSLLACDILNSKAKGRASNLGCESDVGLINGEPDAGVKLSVMVKNLGEAGLIRIKPEISTSEGEWNRSQKLQFNAGETKTLTYFFHEPTINATGIQCRVSLQPQAD